MTKERRNESGAILYTPDGVNTDSASLFVTPRVPATSARWIQRRCSHIKGPTRRGPERVRLTWPKLVRQPPIIPYFGGPSSAVALQSPFHRSSAHVYSELRHSAKAGVSVSDVAALTRILEYSVYLMLKVRSETVLTQS